MQPDSPLVTEVRWSKRALQPRPGPVGCVIAPTTGGGIVATAIRRGLDPLDYAADHYARPDVFASHYLVGWAGEVIQTVPEAVVALHAGVSTERRKLYRRGLAVWRRHVLRAGKLADAGVVLGRYADWRQRWPDLTGPHQLVRPGGVNAQSVGVDLLAPPPGETHREPQIAATGRLVADVLGRHALVASRETVLRHADVDPLTRTSAAGGWDPPWYAFVQLCSWLGFPAAPAAWGPGS